MNVIIEKEFRFEASHVLPKHEGKCARLHGHSWVLRVAVEGPVDPENGFVLDYAKLKACVQPTIDLLDHAHLGYGGADTGFSGGIGPQSIKGAIPPFGYKFYPSSENLVIAIASILQPLIPELKSNVVLHSISLDETCTSRATYYVPRT